MYPKPTPAKNISISFSFLFCFKGFKIWAKKHSKFFSTFASSLNFSFWFYARLKPLQKFYSYRILGHHALADKTILLFLCSSFSFMFINRHFQSGQFFQRQIRIISTLNCIVDINSSSVESMRTMAHGWLFNRRFQLVHHLLMF